MPAPREKEEALRELAKKRKLAEKCRQARIPEYRPLADYHDGIYECDYVSPWSKSAHNVNAEVMIVGHDWSSKKWMCGPIDPESAQLGYSSRFPTNERLFKLLKCHFDLLFPDVYATNAFPFIKEGESQGSIEPTDMRSAAREFLLPQIEIIRPLIVICLGKATFNAVRTACDLNRVSTLDEAIESPFVFRSSKIHAVAHTGSRATNQRGRDQIDRDWVALRHQFDKLCASHSSV